MKPRFFISIAAFTAAWAVLGASYAQAQPPTPPKPFPIVPATVVAETTSGTVVRCGEDVVFFQAGQGNFYQLRVKIVRFSNDPRPRAVKFYLSGTDYRVFAAASMTMAPGENAAPSIFVEDPVGFWRTYVSSSEYLSGGPATLMTVNLVVIIRQRAQDCLLFKEVRFADEKG